MRELLRLYLMRATVRMNLKSDNVSGSGTNSPGYLIISLIFED